MAFHYTTQGIILKQRDQGEANRTFLVFTREYGKLKLSATSVRKSVSKLRGGLQLFSLSQLSFVQGKNKKVVVEAIPLVLHVASFADPSLVQAASQIAHLIDQHMGEQEKDERVWELLVQCFSQLHKGRAYEAFAPKFLTLAGYGT